MSHKHPIVAVTGSSGAGTTTVRHAFRDIFRRENITAVFVEGDSFRRFDRHEMKRVVDESIAAGRPISHFGPEANLFDKMEELFRTYAETGSGLVRHYVRNDESELYGQEAGTFTPWETIPPGSDLLFYEGLHGGVVANTWTRRKMSPPHNPLVIEERRRREQAGNKGVDVAQWVDLLIGVVPIVNLEWIQKIHRDVARKNRTPESVTATILRRMRDYIHFIVPQFSLTDINFQRVPLVDTSNPFIARDIPTPDESIVVIRFREPKKFHFPPLLRQIQGSFMSRPNTMVAPGGEMANALEIICTPIIHELVERSRSVEI
ncbi:MAG: phosphoribulokinase [Gammaproteobacteria bacterium]